MSILLLALIIIGLGALVILVASLFDRLNVIEKIASENRITNFSSSTESPSDQNSRAAIQKSGAFGGLTGDALWEAMTGKDNADVPNEELERMRPRYQFVLTRHIATLFDEGRLDAKQGYKNDPSKTLLISTLRGSVESWIPPMEASSLYKLGRRSSDAEKSDLEIIKQDLDNIATNLFSQVDLVPSRSLSALLIEVSDNENEN